MRIYVLAAVGVLGLAGCKSKRGSVPAPESRTEERANPKSSERSPVTLVTAERIHQADLEPGNWLTHGRTYSEQRFSPLDQINRENVQDLGLDWYVDFDVERGMEATPLVIDARLYTTTAWSIVHALDARTGKALWSFDPEVPKIWGKKACCDVVNRGVAAWEDKIYVGTIDGRLIALEARTGRKVWDVNTIDRTQPYTITGAPRVFKGKVLIGNGGAELGVRGYISAYDAATGEMVWRFHTVPGNPDLGFESDVMKMAAGTWKGNWWEYGGGGTVWDSFVYDPELDLVYIGVGNGSPWNRALRSPGGGDNLFLSSIVALRPDTGEYVWHYQTTPGDTWDFTAAQHIMLLDLEIGGRERKVLVQAPKNGFFYVIDRRTGELISANNFVPVNWAKRVDLQTGRPVENPEARYGFKEPALVYPSAFGAHNWHPMAYSPRTGYVYFSAQEMPFLYHGRKGWTYKEGEWNLGVHFSAGSVPEDPGEAAKIVPLLKGRLLAWDPVKNDEAFRVEHPGPWNGGVLATAGGLVFQGTPGGEFAAYADDTGEKLWSTHAQTGVVAGPISYSVDGVQYIAISVGWGTVFGLIVPGQQVPKSRLLVFKAGGTKQLPAREVARAPWPDAADMPVLTGRPDQISAGRELYLTRCVWCHGDAAMSGGVLPDLRKLTRAKHAIWNEVVLEGAYVEKGMPGWKHLMSEKQSRAIQQYIIKRAHDTRPQAKGG